MKIETRLNHYIHQHIPITKALGCTIKLATRDKVVVMAPFSNNINHQSTVFGGSLHAVATLACWGLLYANFIDRLETMSIVVNHSEISYLKPITKDFDAIALRPEQANWEKFERMVDRKGKGRIEMDSVIYEDGMLAVAYKGAFVVSERGIVVPT